MTTNTQGYRPWNTFQSVAGRPCESNEERPSSSYSAKQTTSKRKSNTWLTRTPSGKHLCPRQSIEEVNFKFTYPRSHPLVADGDTYMDERIVSSTQDMVDYLVHFSSSPAIPEMDHDFDEFEDSDSETDIDSESDSEAQYITIPADSPWWKAPRSSDSPSFSSSINSGEDDEECMDDPSSSHSLPVILEKQQFLVDLFHDELRRIMPGDAPYEYDEGWLKEVDAKLLLAPVEAFEETCKSSMTQASRPLSTDFGSKPVPDVPVDFEEEEDDESIEGWEYPIHAQRVHFYRGTPCLNGQILYVDELPR